MAAPQGSFLNDPRAAALTSALVGMLVAWGVTELTNLVNLTSHANSKTGLDAYVGVWTGALAVLFVGVLVGFDRAVGGAWGEAASRAVRSAIPAAIVGFIAGFAAQAVYIKMIESAFKAGDYSSGSARLYFARAVGWAIFGLGAGVVLGIIDRSPKKAVNGAVGGLVGGAIGGVVFQFTGLHLGSSDRLARLLGLLAVGVLVALATRAIEAARREAWLRVVAGGMTGKEFILYHAVTRIGSSPQCEIFLLKDPAVEPLHAQIEDRGTQRILTASPSAPVLVNGSPTTSHVLRHGETIQIGKTVIAYAERASDRTSAGDSHSVPMKFTAARLSALALALTLAPNASASRPSIVAHASRSVVLVEAGDVQGSAFAFGHRGDYLTNAHVVRDVNQVTLVTDRGRRVIARVVARNDRADVARLHSRLVLPLLRAAGRAPRPGEAVLAIGAANGLQGTVTEGIVSAVGREVGGVRMIQTDAALNPGSSGGVLLNASGGVLGVTTSLERDTQGIAFAIPIRTAETAANTQASLRAARAVARGGLGLAWVVAIVAGALVVLGAAGSLLRRRVSARRHSRRFRTPTVVVRQRDPQPPDPEVVIRRRTQPAAETVPSDESEEPHTDRRTDGPYRG